MCGYRRHALPLGEALQTLLITSPQQWVKVSSYGKATVGTVGEVGSLFKIHHSLACPFFGWIFLVGCWIFKFRDKSRGLRWVAVQGEGLDGEGSVA